jgi:hypothetical protein
MIILRSVFFIMRNVSDESCRENQNTHFTFIKYFFECSTVYEIMWKSTWSDNKVRELIAVKVLHTSLFKTTVVAFKVLPLGSYAPMSGPSTPFKTL